MSILEALYVCGILGVYVALVAFRTRVRIRREANRYRLFAVRDRLVLLVAAGWITEEDPVFQGLYGRVNALVARENTMTSWSFAKFIVQTFGQEPEQSVKELSRAIATSNDEVKEAAHTMQDTILEILHSNSTVLRWFLSDNPVMSFIGKVGLFTECVLQLKHLPQQGDPADIRQAEENLNGLCPAR